MREPFDPQHRRRLVLKRGRERAVANRHPWIFGGAIAEESGPDDAAIADLVDGSGARSLARRRTPRASCTPRGTR